MRTSSTFDGKADLFGRVGQAADYAKFRPRYSERIAEDIVHLLNEKDLCVDVACGSGQLTTLLSPHFKKVLGD